MKNILVAGALILAPALGHAQLVASAEAFASFSEFDNGGNSVDGDGYGLRGRVNLPGTGLFIRAEYLDESLDNNVDYTETRIGGGLSNSLTPLLDLTLELQYIDLETENALGSSNTEGYGAFVGLETNLPLLTLYGRAGYLLLESDGGNDTDGTELLLGARFSVLPFIGIFAEYRSLALDPDFGADLDVDGFRVGARVSF